MNTPTTAIATKPTNDVRALLVKPETIRELGRVATKHLTADRLARLVLSACNRVPKLLECTPQSVLQCAITCSQYGVEPDGRHCHLIPYFNSKTNEMICTLQFDWKGLVVLGRRGGVEAIVPDTICERDEFTYYRDEAGTHFKHVPKFGDRGEIIGAYSTAKIDGQFDVEVVTREEIDGIRKRSKSPNAGPWVTDFSEMAKKTALKRHSKRWPLTSELAEALNADDDGLADIKREPEIRKPLFSVPAVEIGPASEEQIPGAEIPARPRRGRPPKAPVIEQEAPAVKPQAPTPMYDSQSEVNTPQDDLAEFVTVACTASFENFTAALVNMQWAKGAAVDVWTGFEDVPLAMVQHCLKRKDALGARLEDEKAMNQAEA